MPTPDAVAAKLVATLNSPRGYDEGFRSPEVIPDEPGVLGVEVDGDLVFVTVTPA